MPGGHAICTTGCSGLTDRAQVIAELLEAERAWSAGHAPGGDGGHWGNLMYPLEMFAGLADPAVVAVAPLAGVRRNWFCEIGCGIGTKTLYMQRMHQMEGFGIERERELADEAGRLGVRHVRLADALDCSYPSFDVIYLNHPLKDPLEQLELARRVQRTMAPGAVLIGVNQALEQVPPPEWEPITKPRSWPVHGVWRKPLLDSNSPAAGL